MCQKPKRSAIGIRSGRRRMTPAHLSGVILTAAALIQPSRAHTVARLSALDAAIHKVCAGRSHISRPACNLERVLQLLRCVEDLDDPELPAVVELTLRNRTPATVIDRGPAHAGH